MLDPTITATLSPEAPELDGLLFLAKEHCEQNGLGSSFQKETKRYFLKSLARCYWMPIRQFMATTAWPIAKAAKAAGIDPSTPTRWDTMIPNFETVCLLFARCDLDLTAVGFPNGHAAFKSAFLKTIEFIRFKYVDGREARLDDETFECLRLVLSSTAFLNGLQVNESAPTEDADDEFPIEEFRTEAEMIASALRSKYPRGKIRSCAAVQQVTDDWLIPWVLIYIALPPAKRGERQ